MTTTTDARTTTTDSSFGQILREAQVRWGIVAPSECPECNPREGQNAGVLCITHKALDELVALEAAMDAYVAAMKDPDRFASNAVRDLSKFRSALDTYRASRPIYTPARIAADQAVADRLCPRLRLL